LALGQPFKAAVWAGRLWPVPIIAIAIIFVFIPWSSLGTLTSTIISGASAWLILPLWAQTHRGLARVLEFTPIRYVGRISYGLYLWHWPTLLLLWELHFAHDAFVTAALAIAITLICAAASFRFVEQPILRRKPKARASA
jgi:peptidoglycan/LPS O-acetylase OafA/YrhL